MIRENFDVFLAFNPQEAEAAGLLFTRLDAVDFKVYFPKTGADSAVDPKEILTSCKSLLILIGQAGSDATLISLAGLANSMNLPILQVVLPGADPDYDILKRWPDVHQVSINKGLDDPQEFESIVQAIRSMIGGPILGSTDVELESAETVAVGESVNVKIEVDSATQTQSVDQPTTVTPHPQPEQPKKTFSFDYLGVRVQFALTERGWRLPVDALVLPAWVRSDTGGQAASQTSPPALVFDTPAGSFYQSLRADLDADSGTRLEDLIRGPYPSLSVGAPLSFDLPPDLGEKVLPFGGSASRRIFIATLQSDPTASGPENVYQLIPGLVTAASLAGVRRIALPLLGAGTSPPALPPDEVARKMVEALIGIEDFKGLQSILILTIVESAIAAARLKYNLLTNNLAQALGNDEPRGPDLLGISKEVEALAETLLLRRVRPPLAVGILGGWGSGKSFVMHLMWERMKSIRCKLVTQGYSEDPDDSRLSAYVGHIYQIRFNAWTYAKSNLWASLMQTIFFEINRQLSIEQILAQDHDPLAGGGDYGRLYGTFNLANQTSLWETLRLRKQHDLMRLRATEKEIAGLKADMQIARDTRQKDELKNLGDEGQQAAVAILTKKASALVTGIASREINQVLEKEKTEQHVSEKDVEELIAGLRSIWVTLLKLWQVATGNPWKTLGFLLFAILVVLGSIWLTDFFSLAGFQRWVSRLVLWAPLAYPVVRVAANWSKRVNELVDEYLALSAAQRAAFTARLDERMQQRRAEDDEVVKALLARQDLDQQQVDTDLQHMAQAGNLAAYDQVLASAEALAEEQRRRVGPTARYVSLLEFVQARQDAATYETQLGLMHQVKTDIDELTNALTEQEGETAPILQTKRQLFPRGEPRVVLYIDDLDRCPPPRVVEMLEAVQLLLSTPLFIVVLGLDTRYVTKALEKKYKDILVQEGDPSGLDYIEKIIQIPYRVRPISPKSVPKFLQGQMDILQEVAAFTATERPSTVTGQPPVAPDADGGMVVSGDGGPPPTADGGKSPEAVGMQRADRAETAESAEGASQTEAPLPSEVVRFTQEDYQDLAACCSLVSLTPRSVKRLVNVFKLIEVFWFRNLGRDETRPIKQTVIALLALSAAYPEVMREAYAQMEVWFHDQKASTTLVLIDFLSDFQSHNPELTRLNLPMQRFSNDVERLKHVAIPFEPSPVTFCRVTLEQLTTDTFNLICSFSFVGDALFNFGADSDKAKRSS